MASKPLIIGHRGAAAVAPENTLSGFSRALADGADGIEFDVRLSADGVPVVIHDADLKRTAGVNARVSELSATELQRCDVTRWFSTAHKIKAGEFLGVPSLAQVFELIGTNKSILYLEMKPDAPRVQRLVETVVQEIRLAQFARRVIVSSFDLNAIKLVKGVDKEIRTAALFEPKLSRPVRTLRRLNMPEIAREFEADEIALHYTLASPRVLNRSRVLNLPVVLWTIDDPKWVDRARSLAVKALITNNPALLIKQRNLFSSSTAVNTAR